ncbi:MAG: hypothetical protein QXV37_03010 [Candidatus Jordarchaeaceae archaeon]
MKFSNKKISVKAYGPFSIDGKLIELLEKSNPNGPSGSKVSPKDMSDFRKIELPIIPVDGYVADEKLMEA